MGGRCHRRVLYPYGDTPPTRHQESGEESEREWVKGRASESDDNSEREGEDE